MDQLWIELVKSSSTGAIIGIIVWWTLRDHAKVLRSIDVRLGKVLERIRMTPPQGQGIPRDTRDIPTGPIRRMRSRHDSDEDQSPSLPRTITDDDIEG